MDQEQRNIVKPELHRILKVPRPLGAEVQPYLGSGVPTVLVAVKVALLSAVLRAPTKPVLKTYGDNNMKRAAKVDIMSYLTF